MTGVCGGPPLGSTGDAPASQAAATFLGPLIPVIVLPNRLNAGGTCEPPYTVVQCLPLAVLPPLHGLAVPRRSVAHGPAGYLRPGWRAGGARGRSSRSGDRRAG